MNTTQCFAQFLADLRFEDLPTDTVEAVKKQVLDVLATSLAGGRSRGVKEVYELVNHWGGREESSVISLGGRFPSIHAVLVNSIMAHALDYDDTHEKGAQHPGVVAVPTAFAVAEAIGGVKGTDFISAIAGGVDLACRFGRATKSAKPGLLEGGWHYTSLYGYFNAMAVAGKLYGLGEEEFANALGIAYHQAAGNLQCIRDGALTKRMGPGFASRGGLTAALMAAKGVTGARDVIESDLGVFQLYHAGYDSEVLLDRLGKEFASTTTAFKPYPCCRGNHPYIDAILNLACAVDIRAEEVDEVLLATCNALQILCEPYESKAQPRDVVDSQFSLPWAVACALVRRRVGIAEFTEGAIKEPSLISMAMKVKPRRDPSLPDELGHPFGVKIITKKGTYETTTSYPSGNPEDPLSLERLEDKFRDCASYSPKSFSQGSLNEIVSMVSNLDEVKDVAAIVRMVS